MDCLHCHKPVPDTNYKCPHCGGVLKNGIIPHDFQHQPKRGNSMALTYFSVLIVVVGMAVLGYFMIQQGKQKKAGNSKNQSVDREVAKTNNTQPDSVQNTIPEDSLNSPEDTETNEYTDESDRSQGKENNFDQNNLSDSYNPPSIEDFKPGEEVDIKELIHRGKITIFDFYSEYCGPCKIISPKLEQLDNQRDDIVVVKVDINRENVRGIDWNSPISRQYRLRSIPHFIVYDSSGFLTHEGVNARQYVYKLLYEAGIR